MNAVVDAIRSVGDRAIVGKPQSRERLAAVQVALQCRFPESLVQVLAEFGWVIVEGWQVHGLSGADDAIQEEQLVAESQWAAARCGVPLVCLCDDCGECIFALAIRDGVAVDSIEVWDLHTREVLEGWPSGLTFEAFVRDVCSGRGGVNPPGEGGLTA